MFYFVLFLVTAAASQICDLRECISFSNSILQSGWNFSSNLENIRAVELTGSLQDGCNLSFTSVNKYYSAEIDLEMYSNSLGISGTYTALYDVIYTVIDDYPIKMYKSIEITLQYLSGQSDYFLQAFTNYTALDKFNYTGLVDHDKTTFVNLLKGFAYSMEAGNNATRMLKSEGCKESVAVHLCPCIKPVIKSIEQSGTNLTCTAVSLDDVILEWRNSTRNTSQPVRQTNAMTIRQTNTRLYKSTLEGVEHPATYTCAAVLNSDPSVSVTMDYTIAPVIGQESPEKKVMWLAFIAAAVVIIAILGVSVWWFKFHKRSVSKVNKRNAVVELNPSDVPDAEATPRWISETPIYASLSGMGRAPSAHEDEHVYNRLDQNTMTTSRDEWKTFRNSPVTGRTLHRTLNSSNPVVTGRTLHRTLNSSNPVVTGRTLHRTLNSSNPVVTRGTLHRTLNSSNPVVTRGTLHRTLNSSNHVVTGGTLHRDPYSNNPPPIKPPTLPSSKFTLKKQFNEEGIYHETLDLNL